MDVKDLGRWDRDANALRESRAIVDKGCERGLLAMIVVEKKSSRVRSTCCLSAWLTVHEHPDSDRLWLAEGVRCGQIGVGGKRGLMRRHVALCCDGWVERAMQGTRTIDLVRASRSKVGLRI